MYQQNVKRYLDAPAALAANNARGGRGGARGARGGRGGRGGGGAGRGNGGGSDDDDSDGAGAPAPARGRGRGRARARAAAPSSRGRAAPPPPPPPAPAPASAPITIDDDDDEDYWAAIDDIDAPPPPAPPKPPSTTTRKPLSSLAPKPPSTIAPKPVSTVKPLSTYNPPAASYANAQASSSRLPPPSSAGGAENPIYCMCGTPARTFNVVKEGVNKGRPFWKCSRPRDGPEPQCNFFQWADGEDGGTSQSGAGSYQSQGGAGGYGTGGSGTSATVPVKRRFDDASAPGGRRCDCDLTAVRKNVQKDGPNKGRPFWACPSSVSAKCGFFEWDDEPAGAWAGDTTGSGLGGAAVGGGGGGGTGSCFKVSASCSVRERVFIQVTVRAGRTLVKRYVAASISLTVNILTCDVACPNAKGAGAGAGRSQGAGGGTQSGTCFKCGEEGHWSNGTLTILPSAAYQLLNMLVACPNPDGGGGGGFKRSKTMPSSSGAGSSAECYKCHQTGHYSRGTLAYLSCTVTLLINPADAYRLPQ